VRHDQIESPGVFPYRRNHGTGAAVAAVTTVLLGLLVLVSSCSPRARKPVEGERVLRHEVGRGESLESIADDYYGDSRRGNEIRKFNKLDSGEIEPGHVLRIYMAPDDMEALELRKRARVPYNNGLELASRGSYLDAVNQFREAIEMDPQFTEAVYNLGVTFQKLNAHEKAIEQFESAAELKPGNANYYFAAGNSYYHLQRYHEAELAFERALDRDSGHLKAQYALASCLEKSGKTRKAVRAWHRYLEMDENSEWAQRARERLAELER
jgi:tetratricopeptide (TPR) repeat protein